MQLKVQEAIRKKEKFQREHEEVSRKLLFFVFNIIMFMTMIYKHKNHKKKIC